MLYNVKIGYKSTIRLIFLLKSVLFVKYFIYLCVIKVKSVSIND